MNVIRLVEYVGKDTISTLKVLLGMALKGELRGLVVCYRTQGGEENTICTGSYKANRSSAANAALRMSVEMMRANGEFEAH